MFYFVCIVEIRRDEKRYRHAEYIRECHDERLPERAGDDGERHRARKHRRTAGGRRAGKHTEKKY